MGPPAAKQGDKVVAVDIHIIQPPGPTSPIPVPHPYNGIIDGGLSSNVKIMGMPAATLNSTATNTPPHVPIGGSFVNPPSNRATIIKGSATVMINGKQAARAGDTARTCNDPVDMPVGTVVAVGTVNIGG
ncbi:MAG TPA: PAAR domain-containing protein [Pyrinomonadaceae bacterium]|nr:PAAR domain-containing protein [Pyrinomonadaceae bacterium]